MVERSLVVRFSTKDADVVKRALASLGEEGTRTLKKLEEISKGPGAGLKFINAASKEAEAGLQSLAGRAGVVGSLLPKIGAGGLLAAAGIGTLTAGVTASLRQFAEAERLQLRLEGVLKATGGAAGISAKQLTEYADQIEATTFATKEQVLAATAVLGTFKSVSGSTFREAIALAVDMAEVLGTDVSSAAKILGKALEDPAEGMTSLRKAGVVLNDSQQALIKSLQEGGNKAAAQSELLKELSATMGGTAAKAASGLAGQFDNLHDAIGDVFEGIGELISTSSGFQSWVNDFRRGLDYISEGFKEAAKAKQLLSAPVSSLDEQELNTRLVRQRLQLKELEEKGNFAGVDGGSAVALTRQKQAIIKDIDDVTAALKNLKKETPVEVKVNPVNFKEYLADLKESAALNKLSDKDRAEATALKKAEAAAAKDNIALTKEQREEVRKLAAEDFQAAESRKTSTEGYNKTLESRKRLEQEIADIQAETEALRSGGKEELEIQKEMNRYKAEAANLSAKEREEKLKTLDIVLRQRKAEQDKAAEQEKEQDRLKKIQEEHLKFLQEPFLNATRNIQSTLADSIYDGMKDGFKNSESVVERAADLARRTLSQYLSAISVSVALTGVSGAGGLTSGAAGGASSGIAGSLAQSAIGKVFSSALGSSGIFSGFNTAVGTALPSLFGAGAPISATVAGPTLAGQAGLLGSLGITPIGAVAALVATLALSGVFGKKPSNKQRYTEVDFSNGLVTQGGQEGKKYSAEHQQAADALAASTQAIAATLAQSLGQKIDEVVRVYVGGRTGITASVNGSGEERFSSAEDYLRAITRRLVEDLKDVPDELGTALDKIDFKNVEQAVSDINFALNFDKLGAKPETVTQYQQAIKELNAAFDEAVKTAAKLGLSEEQVNEARQKQIANLREQFNSSVGSQILGIVSPGASQILEVQQEFENLVKDAKAVGADTSAIEFLRDLKIRTIIEQDNNQRQLSFLQAQQSELEQTESKWRSFANGLKDFRQSLLLGALSPLSPEQRLSEARTRFNDVARRAQLGDQEAVSELQSASQDLLNESRSYFASSESYYEDFKQVTGVLENTENLATRQANIALGQFTEAQKQTELLAKVAENTAGGIPASALDSSGKLKVNPNNTLLAASRYEDGVQKFGNLNYEQVISLIRSTGFTGTPGGGAVSRFFDSNPSAALTFYSLAKAAGIPGFAKGGTAQGLFMAGEAGPELIYSASPVRVVNNTDTTRILSGNDNSLAAAVTQLNANVTALRAQQARETSAILSELGATRAENAELKANLQRLNSKR